MKRAAFLVNLRGSRALLYSLLTITLFGFGAGCYSPGRSYVSSEVAPADTALRSSFGRMGLLIVDRGPVFAFRYPKTHGEATMDIAESTFKAGDYDDGFGDFVGGLIFSGAVGAIGGAFAGVPREEIYAAEERMRQAVRQQPIMAEISSRLQAGFERRGQPAPMVIPEELADPLKNALPRDRDYGPLNSLGIDSVLEIAVEWHGFRGPRGESNPPLMMEASVQMYITRISDGALLFNSPLQYHGHQHTFRCWADEDARRFRSELRRIGRMVGQGVAEQLLGPTLTATR